jgi:glycolate oxidase FAD binding subunit
VELIHPASKADLAGALREASADGRRILLVGGRHHMDKGNPVEVDAELWTTQLDRIVAYEPAEMIAVVEAGVRIGELAVTLAEGGQEWPTDAPDDATVGGVIAAAVNSPRRLRVGAIRDTVLEVELVTGDGRLLRGGARTVKNVAGYDLPRLATGSLGTLGAIAQVALKLRPLPKERITLVAREVDGLELGARLLNSVPLPTAVLATPDGVELRLEGWPEEVRAQAAVARGVAADLRELDEATSFPSRRPWESRPVVVEAAVPPSAIPALASTGGDAWGALLGIGLLWIGLADDGEDLAFLRTRAVEVGGIAPVIRGPGGIGPYPSDGAKPLIHQRLRQAFDPAGVLAPGRQ